MIKNSFFRTAAFLLMAVVGLLTASCTDNLLNVGDRLYEGDNRQVDISLSFGASDAHLVTRMLDEQGERQVNDLFVLGFPVSGTEQSWSFRTTGVFKAYFDYDRLESYASMAGHQNSGKVTLHGIPTGSYVFYAVANVKSSEYGAVEIYEALQQVEKWEDFQNLRAKLGTKGSVDRISPALLMSGHYEETPVNGTHTNQPKPVQVQGNAELPGYIHLIRTDAKVRFNILCDIPNAKLKSFVMDDWQVCNVPDDVTMWHDGKSTPTSVTNSGINSVFEMDGNTHSFEFYIPEALFTVSNAGLDNYDKREERVSNTDRAWKYAPANAPYVQIRGKLEMLVDDPKNSGTEIERYAEVTYTIHLGYCDGADAAAKAKDFNTDRNTKYTYNVHVEGVDKIRVEAERTTDQYQNSVEGMVFDNAGGSVIEFDSHYGIANIVLTQKDLETMSVMLSSVCGDQKYLRDIDGNLISDGNTLNKESEDFQAFRFAFEPESTASLNSTPQGSARVKFVSYSQTYDAGSYLKVLHNEVEQGKNANHDYALYDLLSMLEGIPFDPSTGDPKLKAYLDGLTGLDVDQKKNHPLVFTVFVNENVYYTDKANWHEFAHSTKDRVLRMFVSNKVSSDRESEYIRGKYILTQKPCQTYYSDVNDEALCVEYVNEHHHKDMKNTKGADVPKGQSVKSGWTYVNAELQNKNWNDCANQTLPLCDHYNAFYTLAADDAQYAKNIPGSTDGRDYEAVYASLSRNRDLNRDGVIQSRELKWFLPSMEQYIQMVIGGAALHAKIFVPDDYNNWNETVEGPKGNIFNNERFHFIGVERKSKFWAEEGYTVGDQSVEYAARPGGNGGNNPWEIRCVRMLVDQSRMGIEIQHWADFEDLYHWVDETRKVISMDKYRMEMHRQPINGWLQLHPNSDDVANSTYQYFQFAQQDAALVDVNPGEAALVSRMNNNLYCKDYTQEPDGSDRGTWRVPNQRETAVMRYLAGINNNTPPLTDAYYLSCSIWPFPSSKPRGDEKIDFCTIGNNPTKSSPGGGGQLASKKLRVRCVRDTDIEGNYVGAPEFGNSIEFKALQFYPTYSADGTTANYEVDFSFQRGTLQSVTVDGEAITTATDVTIAGEAAKQVKTTGTHPIQNPTIKVVWKFTLDGKTLTYERNYSLPVRYWVIESVKTANSHRLAYAEGGKTKIDASANAGYSNMADLDVKYKWILSSSPLTATNVSNLVEGEEYYLFNIGEDSYVEYPAFGGDRNEFPLGIVQPMKVKLYKSTHNGGYSFQVMDSSDSAKGWVNLIGNSNFGFWNTTTDQHNEVGNSFVLHPQVKGTPVLNFIFHSFEKVGSNYVSTVHMHDNATVTSITFNGVDATSSKTGGNGTYSAKIATSSVTEDFFEVVWTVSLNGKTYTMKQPNIPYYVINNKNALTQYAYAAASNENAKYDASANSTRIENLDNKYKWIVTRNAPTGTNLTNIIPETSLEPNVTYYLYNIGTKTFLSQATSQNGNVIPMNGTTPYAFKLVSVNEGAPYFRIHYTSPDTYANCYGGFPSGGFGVYNSASDGNGIFKFNLFETSK